LVPDSGRIKIVLSGVNVLGSRVVDGEVGADHQYLRPLGSYSESALWMLLGREKGEGREKGGRRKEGEGARRTHVS
jgi:hypothetical protein